MPVDGIAALSFDTAPSHITRRAETMMPRYASALQLSAISQQRRDVAQSGGRTDAAHLGGGAGA